MTTRRPVPTLVKFKFISNNQFYIMVHFARGMKQTTIINSNDSRQSVCFYNYVYSTFLHIYTYIYISLITHSRHRQTCILSQEICIILQHTRSTPSILVIFFPNHKRKLLFTWNLVLHVKQWRIVDCIVERNWLQCLPKYQLHQENVLKMTVF